MVPEIVPEKREAEPILVHLANKTFHLLIYNEKLYIPTHETGISGKFVFVEASPYEDFLIVWSYFACKGNSRALRILMWLAQLGLNQYLKPWGDSDGMVSSVRD